MKKFGIFALVFLVCGLVAAVAAQKIYWGDSVPKGWNGSWSAKFLTVPEKTEYERTTSSYELLEFIDVLKWNSEKVNVVNMYTSAMRKACPVVVLANPRITSPEEAAKSGKTVVYLQGNIHPGEAEAKEALLMLMREILFGKMKHLLDNLIIICCPCFNVDGTDSWSLRDGTPHIGSGSGTMNLNRDAVKVESVEVTGLYRTIFNRWDPTLIYDGHAMGRVQHGYGIAYATCTVPTAHPGPRSYVFDKLFPSIREATRKDFGLEVFTHCDIDNNWPPTTWSHEAAIWSNEAKFVANMYGLRNRMSILAETPGHESFQRKIYAHYALIAEILEFANTHGKEMQEICRSADQDVVEAVKAKAESGELRNFTAGKYESWGKIDVLAYRKRNVSEYVPGTSVRSKIAAHMLEPPEVVHDVENITKPVGTAEATVPRGYLIPAELDFIAEKLRTHNVRIEVLAKPIKVMGEEFVIDRIVRSTASRENLVKLEGGFAKSPAKEFPAGTFRVDMAQPAANVAFYCLEPQAADGFVGWRVLDNYLKSLGSDQRSIVYPIYKYFKILE
jgi:hypothetical protein